VEAMIDVVERDFEPWNDGAGRRTSLWAAVLLLLPGAGALLLQHGSDDASTTAVVIAVALVLGAVVLSRARHATEADVTISLVGCLYAAAAGQLIARGTPSFGNEIAAAGAGALAAGLVGVLGLVEARPLLLPPVICGAVFLAAGLMVRTWS